MPSPAQTPALFLEGGGADIFSDACVEALLKAGYNPDWFGSWAHVKKQIKGAQSRVAKHKEWVEKGKVPPAPPLHPNDEYLASCQSGHISQDATHCVKGGRSDPCGYLEDGYDTKVAPCMPQSGEAWKPPGGEHNIASRHEVKASLRHGENQPLDPAVREQDEKERLKLVVDAKPAGLPSREPISKEDFEKLQAEKKKDGKTTDAVDGKDASAGTGGKDQKINGETPEDCINNFKNAAMQAMRAKVAENRIKNAKTNREVANGGPQQPGESDADYEKRGKAYRDDLNAKAKAAQDEADELKKERQKDREWATKHADRADEARQKADGDPDDAASRDKSRDQGEKAQRKADRERMGSMLIDNAEERAKVADAANKAQCEASEGERLGKMSPEALAAATANPMPRPDRPAARSPNVHPDARTPFNEQSRDNPIEGLDT